MTYKEAEAYLAELQTFGMVPGLSSIRELCRRLGNPQGELSFVHIAGSNGKGSVLALVSTVLTAAGYRVGRYLSPTIFEYRERIQINGHIISKVDFCRYLALVKAAADSMAEAGLPHPTPFEMDTAMAFCYLRDKKCEIVVLETGLGGSLDATNIIENTLVAVITPVSLEHQDYLGSSIGAIAAHKAGIIKKGSRVVSAPQLPEAAGVIAEKCRALGCPLTVVRPEQVSAVKYGNYARYGRGSADGRDAFGGENAPDGDYALGRRNKSVGGYTPGGKNVLSGSYALGGKNVSAGGYELGGKNTLGRENALSVNSALSGKIMALNYSGHMAGNIPRQSFTYGSWRAMEISLAGKYQIENAVLALEVLTALAEQGFPVNEKKLRRGMAETLWPGRFQLLPGKPLVVVDGAHNEAAAEKLADSLKFYFTNRRIIYIMGILRDKDYREIIERTYGLAEQIITVTTPGKRGMNSYELAQEVRQYHEGVTAADSLEEAVEMAHLLAGKDGVVAAFGSLSYLGDLIKIVQR